MKRNIWIGSVMAAVFFVCSTTVAFAQEDSSAYGYLAGQQESSTRHGQFEKVSGFSTDDEREAYFEEQGIGNAENENAPQLDTEDLVEAGVIDEATAKAIAEYASEKQTGFHEKYGNLDDMTLEERAAFYEAFEKEEFDGDVVDDLVAVGVITQEQADAINAYVAGNTL